MQIVIEIDDEIVLSDIKDRCLEAESETDKVIIDALYNGTPLLENVEQAINRLHKHSLNGVVAMDYVEIVLKDVFER